MSRRLQASRERVLEETRRRMRESLSIDDKALDSVLRAIESRLDVSRQGLDTHS